jgi:hypothetical protein
LRALKDVLLELAADRLAELPDADAMTDEALTAALERALTAGGLPRGGDALGDVTGVEVARPAGHRGRFAVTLSLWTGCGADDVFALFEPRDGRLAPALVERADEYASLRRGRLASAWAVSPPDPDGGYYVVVARASPWCTSRWRGTERSLRGIASP